VRTRPAPQVVAALLLAVSGSTACGRVSPFPALPVTPRVEVVGAAEATAGHAVTLRYTWTAAPELAADRPYRVFVHFLDADGAVAFTDDHTPPGGTREWRSGGSHTYERRVVLPDDAGPLRVRVGLTTARFPYKTRVTDAATGAPAFPIVAVIDPRENVALAEEAVAGEAGFDVWERDRHASQRWYRWTRRQSRFLFLQPAAGGRLLLQGYVRRSAMTRDPRVTIRAAGAEASVSPSSDDRFVLELDVAGDGAARLVEGTLVSDEAVAESDREVAVCVERFRVVALR
jgi:hypothetical protein